MISLGSSQKTTIPGLVERAGIDYGNQKSVTFHSTGERFTFSDVRDNMNRTARRLLQLGVKQGDRVALALDNEPFFLWTWLGAMAVGATVIPINTRYQVKDASYTLKSTTASVLITRSTTWPPADSIFKNMDIDLIDVDELFDYGEDLNKETRTPFFAANWEDPAVIQFTSGSTAIPKGCVLSHRYWITLASQFIYDDPYLTAEDIFISAQPMYYMDPQWQFVATLLAGAELVILDHFSPSNFFRQAAETNATVFYCLGVMPKLLLKADPGTHSTSHKLRYVACSGIPTHLHRELEVRFNCPWHELYGSTETGANIRVPSKFHDVCVGTGILGWSTYTTECIVVDENYILVPRGTNGQLLVRGLGLMDGYIDHVFGQESGFIGGWYPTGDIVRQNIDDSFTFVGRIKDIIRRSDENISAPEVEDTIAALPDVLYTACVPVQDPIRGEEVMAYIVHRHAEGSEEELALQLSHSLRAEIAEYKIPRYWRFVTELPLTPSEKVMKHKLDRDPIRKGTIDIKKIGDDGKCTKSKI